VSIGSLSTLLMSEVPLIFLIDNGSLRPEATFALRELALGLSARTGFRVEPVSLLHSHKIASEDLDGVPATIVRRRLRELIEAGERAFIMLPLFLGPSLAIQDYLPQLIEEAQQIQPEISVTIADPLAGVDVDHPDLRLAKILADHVRQTMEAKGLIHPKVALADHGTPIELVNRVRNAVAAQLAEILADDVCAVKASSMERREGEAYAFNEPLLERIGEVEGFAGGDLIVAMFFLLPGRHAGEGGDVAEICEGLLKCGAFDRVCTTPLLGTHPLLLELLEDRLMATMDFNG